MRGYTADLYRRHVEEMDDPVMQGYMRAERSFLARIPGVKSRTVVELGAGYGRSLPHLAEDAAEVIAIEINPDMHAELARRAAQAPRGNATAVLGDFFNLDEHLPETLDDPVFLLLQNTFGTIEGGNSQSALEAIVPAVRARDGELVLSLLRQPVLAGWGLQMYGKLQEMVGIVDREKSDFEQGLLVTDTGYTSRWWTDDDIDGFRQLGTVIREERQPGYHLMQIDL